MRARGYPGAASSVRPYLALLRQAPDDLLPTGSSRMTKSVPEKSFSVRQIIWLALSLPEKRTREQTQELTRIASLHAEIENALILAQLFVKMLREQDVQALPAWLTFAQASSVPELRQFAKSALNEIVRQWKRPSPDQKAMDPETGLITKLKFIKRSMYGRGSFALLRLRVLQAA